MEYDCQRCGACCIDALGRNSYGSLSAAEALAFHFAGMRKDGDVIPAPRSFEELKHDPESSGIPRTRLSRW